MLFLLFSMSRSLIRNITKYIDCIHIEMVVSVAHGVSSSLTDIVYDFLVPQVFHVQCYESVYSQTMR